MEETVILEFKVDQADAQRQLEQTEKALIDLREEQAALRKEYNAGKITQDQYIKENLKLQNSLKKETDQKRTLIKTVETESNSRNALRLQISKLTKEYDNLNKGTAEGVRQADKLEKELAQLNTQLTKGDKAAGLFKNQVGNYPKMLGEAASQIQVAGVSVGDLTTKFAAFANPATAAVGALSALVGLYANSAAGAKDAAYATDLLSGSISIISNQIGNLVGDTSGGEGIFSQITSGILKNILGTVNAAQADILASAQEQLRELEIINVDVQGIRKQYEKAAEEARRIRDDDEKSLQDRLKASEDVDKQLNANLLVREVNQKRIIAQLQIIAGLSGGDPTIRKAIKQAQAELRDAQEEITGKLTENVTARRNILKLTQEQAELERGATRRANTSDDAAILTGSGQTPGEVGTLQPTESAAANAEAFQTKHAERMLQINADFYKKDAEFKRQSADLKAEIDRDNLRKTEALFAQTADLFQEGSEAFKILTTGQIIANTYSAATAALAPPPLGAGPIFGPAFAAVAIATGLANLARVNGIQFAEGGYTGAGAKYDVAGVVHKGEYVAPKHIVESSQAQPHLRALETMRTRGYADGGFVTNQNIEPTQQALIMANALRNLPQPIVGVTEITTVQRRIAVRENLSKLR